MLKKQLFYKDSMQSPRTSGQDPLLEVKHLKTAFKINKEWVSAVRDVSFRLFPGETLGIIGESGCGKSVTSLSLMQLIPRPNGRIESGEVLFEGQNLLQLKREEIRKIRGSRVAMIFQEPMTSLNPVLTVGEQVIETILAHSNTGYRQAKEKTLELFRQVGLTDVERRFHNYPHQLSGGMKQRIMIAMALSCDPDILIADEPTTALDVTIQAQILKLLKRIQQERSMSLIMITHDLGVIANSCDYVLVMYAGKIVEQAPVKELFQNPGHPYTQGLLNSLVSEETKVHQKLNTIPGMVPALTQLTAGCSFANRCSYATEECTNQTPEFIFDQNRNHGIACYHPVQKKN